MCRLMAYIGPPRLIADVVLWPDRSIIKQSYDARERLQDPSLPNHLGFGNLNGDGFGIGWYTPDELRESDPTPCMYKSITPAWNNENLARLSCKIISPLVFAHVRAAYPGMPVSEQNCHPFHWGRYIWMHNGVVGGFSVIKRRLLEQLSDAAYNSIQSFHSDSAVSFAVFLNQLPDLVHQQPPDVLVNAMQAAISTICEVQEQLGVRDVSLLNFVVSDGSTLIATRFVRPESEGAATLYYAEGASFDRQQPQPQQQQPAPVNGHGNGAGNGDGASSSGDSSVDEQEHASGGGGGHASGEDGCTVCGANNLVGSSVLREASYSISYSERGANVAFVASEPITGSTTDWVAVPKNTVLVVTREKGGYLSMLQSSLSMGRQPDPRLQEVATCLAAIAQGVRTKSRAWVSRRNTPQQLQQAGGAAGASAMLGGRRSPGASPFGLSMSDALLSPGGSGLEGEGSGNWVDGLLGSMGLAAEPETISMEEEHLLTGHRQSVLALVLDEPSQRLYSSSTDATVRAWDLSDMACVAVIRGHSKPVTKLQLLGGRLLFTAAGGGVRVWDTRTFVCLAKIRTSFYAGAIRSMLVTPDGTIYVGHQDTTVKKYLPMAADAGSAGLPVSPRVGAAGAVRAPDACSDPSVGHVGPVNDLVACGQFICSAGGDTTVRVWRASDLGLVKVLRGHRSSVLCLLAIGNLLLSGSRDNTIRVWDLDLDCVCRSTLQGHKDDVVHLDALGLDKLGGLAATASHSGSSAAPLNACLQQLLDARSPPGAAAGSAGSAGGSNPAAAQLGQAQQRASSPSPYVASVLVASASADGTVRVWSSNWTCLRILTICAPCTEVAAGRSRAWQHAGSSSDGWAREPQAPSPRSSSAAAAAAEAADAGRGGMPIAPAWSGARRPGASAAAGTVSFAEPVAVVAFADAAEEHQGNGFTQQQQQQQQLGSGLLAAASAAVSGGGRSSNRVSQDGSLLSASLDEWSGRDWERHRQQQAQQQQQQQQHSPCSGSASGSGSASPFGKQRCGQQQQRPRQRDGQRHQHHRGGGSSTTAAALVVAISTHHIVGGYSDATIRLWHMDDVYMADFTQQLATGQILQSDLMLWSGQLRSGSLCPAPFLSLSLPGSKHLAGSSGNLQGGGLSMAASGELLGGPSPPLSPTGLAGQLAAQLRGAGALAASQLLREGSGSVLGVELLAPDRPRRRGAWCARLRDAGCCSTSASASSAELAAAAAAALAGGSPRHRPSAGGCSCGAAGCAACAAAAGGAGVACLACGSQDQQLVRALKEFVAIRTVSANKALRDECLRGAKYLTRLLEALGAEVKTAQPYEAKNPVVLGRLGKNPAAPTVAFYGHYDVQPAEEPDWASDPFEMTAVDGYLCGRGTSDNKGPLLAFIYAVKEMLDCWRLAGSCAPLNFAFMFEGEEENGSTGLRESIAANLDWFSDAVLVVISNTVWVGEHKPCLTYGMRGMVTASLVVSGPERDLHSGNDGGVFSEPMADLVQLLGSFHGPGGVITVPGFTNGVRPQLLELAWQGLQHSDEFNTDSYRHAIGVPELSAPYKFDVLNKRWCSPTLSIVDIRTTTAGSSSSKLAAAAADASAGCHKHLGGCPHSSHTDSASLWPAVVALTQTDKHGAGSTADERSSCYRFGPTRFSVIPKVAVGKLSLRFVPEQDAVTLVACLRHHVEAKFKTLWSANRVELQVHSVGDWWEADPASQLFQMAERAVRREWGVAPLYVREGGTMPVASLIEKMLGAPALMIPMGQSSDNCHLANERLRRTNLIKGKNTVRHLLEEVAAAAAPAAAVPVVAPGGGA